MRRAHRFFGFLFFGFSVAVSERNNKTKTRTTLVSEVLVQLGLWSLVSVSVSEATTRLVSEVRFNLAEAVFRWLSGRVSMSLCRPLQVVHF